MSGEEAGKVDLVVLDREMQKMYRIVAESPHWTTSDFLEAFRLDYADNVASGAVSLTWEEFCARYPFWREVLEKEDAHRG